MVSGCRGAAVAVPFLSALEPEAALSILHEGFKDLQLEATQMSAFVCIIEKQSIWRQCGLSD